MSKGLLIAAPSSGSGKTTLTLGLLRALHQRGETVRGAKSGPDYIDPRFHEAACGAPCPNLDAWAMTPERLGQLAGGHGTLIVEGAMGLFDGAPHPDPALDGKGSAAHLAKTLGLPIVLVIDVARMAGSVAALVRGFLTHDPALNIRGLILNQVGSPRHATLLTRALAPLDIPLLGTIPRSKALAHPGRHLGLVQAGERPDLDHFLNEVAETVEAGVDLQALLDCAAPLTPYGAPKRLAPPAQSIAVAQDAAFAFAYPHLLADWRDQGAEISFFSPLANEAPQPADLTYLPGGYPELHAGQLASNQKFMQGLREAAARRQVYGECGGYMVLGDELIAADGTRHKMAGLLGLETSFADRKLHLGYRQAEVLGGPFKGTWKAHEFHYARTLKASGKPLIAATDAEGTELPSQGLMNGSVFGSFVHLIDRG